MHWAKDHRFLLIVDILRHKITMVDSLRSLATTKKVLANKVVYFFLVRLVEIE